MKGLDKWLTTPPDEGFDNWADDVIDHFTNEYYEAHEKEIASSSGEMNDLINKYFNEGLSPNEAAEKIEREII